MLGLLRGLQLHWVALMQRSGYVAVYFSPPAADLHQ